MATKECPYCHKEIADEAILCKFCHNLLIGGNQDIESAAIASRERAKKRNAMHASKAVDQALGRTTPAPASRDSDEGLTKVFTAVNAADTEEETKAFTVPKQPAAPRPAPQPKHPEPQPVRQPGPQPQPARQPIPQPAELYDDGPYYGNDDGYYDDDRYYDDTYPQDEGYYEPPMHKGSREGAAGSTIDYDEDRYYEQDYYEDDEEGNKKKKIFLITALITFSVIAVVALAIFVGYKLVGFAKNDSSSKSGAAKTSSITRATKITSSTTTTTTPEATTTTKSSETSEDTEQTTESTSDTQWTTSDTDTETQPTSETQPTGETQSSSETQQSQTQQSQSQSEQSQSQTQQSSTIDQAQVLANVGNALAAQNSSGIKSYEYRSEDAGAVYLYIFTNDNHAYSVAYFKASGQSKIVQAW